MSLPVSSVLGFLGLISLGVGIFLVLTGLNIVTIQQVTVVPGKKTWTVGLIFALVGIGFLLPEILKNIPSSSSTASATNQTPTAIVSEIFNFESVYRIVSVYSNKVLAVNGGSQDDEAQIIQDTWRNWKHQLWKFEPLENGDEGYYLVRSANSNKCLDVIGSNVNAGAGLIQYTCAQTNNQKWKIITDNNGGFFIQAKHSDKVLETPDFSEGALIIQSEKLDGKNQLWRIELVEQSPASEPTPALNAPVITDVKIREEASPNGLIIYQDVYFHDPDGDAYYTDWQVVSTTDKGIQVVNGTIDANSQQQKTGTIVTGTWECGNNTYSVTFWVTILDRVGNESNGFEYTIYCK
jgi:hypothetical protein